MKPTLFFIAVMLGVASSWAQVVPAGSGSQTSALQDMEAQRNRIRSARAREEAAFAQAQVECYQRFAVTDCLNIIRKHRRTTLDALRRQEVTLNDLERKRKAQEQIEQIRQKSPAQ